MGGIPRASFAPDKYALTIDGNSIMDAGTGATIAAKVRAAAPINGDPAFSFTNCAIAGQTFQAMGNAPADVLNSYQPGKVNFLLLWEVTNTLLLGASVQACIDDINFCVGVHQRGLAQRYPNEKPWIIILSTALPYKFPDQSNEVKFLAVNEYIRQNFRALGARAYVELRPPGSIFDVQDVTDGTKFGWAKDGLHPTAAADTILAGYVSEVLMRLPAR